MPLKLIGEVTPDRFPKYFLIRRWLPYMRDAVPSDYFLIEYYKNYLYDTYRLKYEIDYDLLLHHKTSSSATFIFVVKSFRAHNFALILNLREVPEDLL